ncbi:MAG TPA: haloalkane dehalogenase [Afifellaceae bacterium]|nr:haloalkane dehalogenase [Afifellaceae bacterium]
MNAPFPKKTATIDGIEMAYRDEGVGDPIIFLHGNPTSSYLWRNIIGHVAGLGRVIAPDLVGMGDSAKLPDSGPDRYTFAEHRHYLDGLLDEILPAGAQSTFVVHDWGSALGFDRAHRHPASIKGICFMEAIVAVSPGLEAFPALVRPVFEGLRSPAGEKMVLEDNIFVEQILPDSILRTLSDEEMAEYRRPFLEPGEARRPTLTWPRQIPFGGEPPDVAEIVASYQAWLPETDFPKLFINADPGAILRGAAREFVRSWSNLTEVTVPGVHFIQEDSPNEIGAALKAWMEDNSL